MYYKAAMICEGGAMTGVYTAGVLDVLMKHDIYTTYAIGVSVGACNAIDYAGGMPGRTIRCMAVKDPDLQFFGIGTLFKRHRFYDFDLCFDQFADHYFPFDYDAYAKSPMQCEAVATDAVTGKPLYLPCGKEHKQMIHASRASASLPYLSRIYDFGGKKCLDGGISDSIPWRHAASKSGGKMIIILTKPKGYRKKAPGLVSKAFASLYYSRYPDFARAMNARYKMYNREIREVEQLEKEGKAFVFQPAKKTVGRMEKDYKKLMAGYRVGVADAERRLTELRNYLEQ